MKEYIKGKLTERQRARESRLNALSAALMRSRWKHRQMVEDAIQRAAHEALSIRHQEMRGSAVKHCLRCQRRHSRAAGCDLVGIRDVQMRNGRTRTHYRVRGTI